MPNSTFFLPVSVYSQIKAAVKVNYEQLLFNWKLGRDLVVRKAEFKGLISNVENQINVRNEKLNQLDSELMFSTIFAFVPWKHHVLIMQKSKSVEEALFYVQKTVEGNLSR